MRQGSRILVLCEIREKKKMADKKADLAGPGIGDYYDEWVMPALQDSFEKAQKEFVD